MCELVIHTNHLNLVFWQTRTDQSQQNEKRLHEHCLELVFDLSVLKGLSSKTGCQEFPEQSCFCVKKLLAYARQYIFLFAVVGEVMDEKNLSSFQIGFLK